MTSTIKQSINTATSKINIAKVNIQSKVNKLSDSFTVVKGALADRLKGLCEHSNQNKHKVPDTSAKSVIKTSTNEAKENKSWWDKATSWIGDKCNTISKNVSEFADNPLKYVDNHLQDIAKIGLFVAGTAIAIGMGGAALAVIAPGLAGTLGTIATVSGTVATFGGGIAVVAGSTQMGTAIVGKNLYGEQLDLTERVDRGIKGAFNTVLGFVSVIQGRKLVSSGKELIEESNKKFSEWLNKGEKENVVYRGVDKTTGEETYTGITKQNLNTRKNQHNYTKKHNFEKLNPITNEKLTRNQAHSIEQYFIEKGPANSENNINSISPNSEFYKQALKWANKYIKRNGIK